MRRFVWSKGWLCPLIVGLVSCAGEMPLEEPVDEAALQATLAKQDEHHAAGPLVFGEVTIDHKWKRVTFARPLQDPVVVAKPFSFNGHHPGVLRLRNVDSTGFELRIQEWGYLDDWHYPERVGYLAAGRGAHALEDGDPSLIAGSFETDQTEFSRVSFAQALPQQPVVLTSITTFAGAETVTGRLRGIDAAGFDYKLQEEEAHEQSHIKERVDYIALAPGAGDVDGFRFVVRTAAEVTHAFKGIGFATSAGTPFVTPPVFVAEMQTTRGDNTASLRWRQKSATGVQLRVYEEQSLDAEMDHTTETVGYLALGSGQGVSTLPPIAWRVSLDTGSKDDAGNVLGGTEIRSLAVFDGKLFAGNGYWTDTQGNPGPQVLVLDRPASEGGKWRQDLRLDPSRHLLVDTMKSVTLATDAQGSPLPAAEHLLLAAGGWSGIPVTTHVRRSSGAWTETTIASCRGSVRNLVQYRDGVTGADMLFAGVKGRGSSKCPTKVHSGVYDASEPGRVRWLGAEPWADSIGEGDDRITSFAVLNNRLYATVCGKVYQRNDGPDPSWRLVYRHPQDYCRPGPGEIGFRGLTPIPSGPGAGSMIAGLENKGLLVRFTVQGNMLDDTVELNARGFLRDQWGISSVGYTILAYDGMLTTTLPGGAAPVLMIGLEARANGGPTWHGWARGAWFLTRFEDGTYQLSEIVDPTVTPKPAMVSTRAMVASPFASEIGQVIYAGGFDANHVNGVNHDTAWLYRGEFQ
jgi:hypothetical protein